MTAEKFSDWKNRFSGTLFFVGKRGTFLNGFHRFEE
jgi:hypothetical protein